MEADRCKDRFVRVAHGLEGLAEDKKVKNSCSQNEKNLSKGHMKKCVF